MTILTDTNYSNEMLKVVISALMGCLVGLEREIRRKPAGFRTMALISVGSTIFTICSYKLGFAGNQDRIAANIITGVGFLGAGVIFRNGFSVSGITTAATIWMSAALGMLIGIGMYTLSLESLAVILVILSALRYLQNYIDSQFQHRTYTVHHKGEFDDKYIMAILHDLKLKARNFKETRREIEIIFEFDVIGKETNMKTFNNWLKENEKIYAFMW